MSNSLELSRYIQTSQEKPTNKDYPFKSRIKILSPQPNQKLRKRLEFLDLLGILKCFLEGKLTRN